MNLSEEMHAETTVIAVAGRLDGATAMTFEEAMSKAVAASGHGIVLDLAHVHYISSAGLRAILVVAKLLQARQTPFAICELSPEVREVFAISGFDRVLRVAGTRAEALAGV
jgi:anti-anti-sigma factor